MIVLNLFAGPGAGKSTAAAETFALLKKQGFEVEYVPEFAKILTYMKADTVLRDQLYLFAKQNHRLEVLRDAGLDFVVMDSPLPISVIYQPKHYLVTFDPIVREVFEGYDNLNFLLHRNHGRPYSTIGRNEDETTARGICSRIQQLLVKWEIQHTEIHDNRIAAKTIATVAAQMLHPGFSPQAMSG